MVYFLADQLVNKNTDSENVKILKGKGKSVDIKNKQKDADAQVDSSTVWNTGDLDDGYITGNENMATRLYDDDYKVYFNDDTNYDKNYNQSTGGNRSWTFNTGSTQSGNSTQGGGPGTSGNTVGSRPSSNDTAVDAMFNSVYGMEDSNESSNFLNSHFSASGDLMVYGTPMKFSGLADPRGRVYRETFFDDIPIIYLAVGTPKVNLTLFGSTTDGKSFSFSNLGKKMVNSAFVMWNVVSDPGNRFINFKPNWSEYYFYIQTMASALYEDMGLGSNFTFGQYRKDIDNDKYGMAFYMSASGTSISESSSNSYAQSSWASDLNNTQKQKREAMMFSGIGGLKNQISSSIAKIIDDVKANVPFLGGFVGAFSEALDGQQVQYPDTWSDSTFDRAYNVEFEFFSPYGDKESIFRYVYLPYILIICMGLPRQQSFYGYQQPFLLRVMAPGWFEIEVGVITSMTITRGDNSLWTVDGLPRVIRISTVLQDLYPNLVVSKWPRRMKYNPSLTSYIETMSGMRRDQREEIVGTKIRQKIAEKKVIDPSYEPDSSLWWTSYKKSLKSNFADMSGNAPFAPFE